MDLSEVQFVTLFDWVSTVAMIEKVMADSATSEVSLDLVGESNSPVLSPAEFIDESKRLRASRARPRAEFAQAERIYGIGGFLESLQTFDALNQDRRASRAIYPLLGVDRARLRSVYSRREREETIVMPLHRIHTKEDCKQFLDEERIVNWRSAMAERFHSSPLFQYEELWRVFCHELAVNVFEHARTAGFIAGRVVEPIGTDGKILPWCSMSYRTEITALLPRMKTGFLELCVSDAGQGFVETLGPCFRERVRLDPAAAIPGSRLLAFAFDEVGTCKLKHESWATQRHALGRILQIVAKYGGALTLRSGAGEVLYVSDGGKFDRIPRHLGYEPRSERTLPVPIVGSHFQLILPIEPFSRKPERRGSVLVSVMPEGFQPDPTHVRGHLVPLLEKLGTAEPSVGVEELKRFRCKCEDLARELIQQRPAEEALVFDFSGLKWTPSQFETALYLLQNVLQSRPVLLVEIDPALAREAVELESNSAPTMLDASLAKVGPDEAMNFNEFSEQEYLETFRGIHATVLGLDINGSEYIFGLPTRGFETLLLGLIDKPQKFSELLRSAGVDTRVLRAVLNNVNPLFELGTDQRWRTVWDRQALAREAKRVMSAHFEEVAECCEAWRGRPASPERVAEGMPKSRDVSGMKFNLPWRDAWVPEFFEASRILSRQRLADEAAQRLIFRLEKGLQLNGKSIGDVHVLACVTAPAILLATALHRWWPGKERPAIADLGPYMMLNPEGVLPAIASGGGIVVVQDVLDRSHISRRLVALLREQKKDVYGIVSLVRLVAQGRPVGVTASDEGWRPEQRGPAGVQEHAMVNLLRPDDCPPGSHEDPQSYWVEPRTLRPFRYGFILRETKPRPFSTERTRPKFFESTQHGVLCAGHYVYGDRHYTVAVDIKRALDGIVGDEVIPWIADICRGERSMDAEWETPRGRQLPNDVSAVLMPLHSQIHYLWPRVEILLAQLGRRQPRWLLDATLFLGHGPAYRLPLQFDRDIRAKTRALLEAKRRSRTVAPERLRILIIDDAMVSARTAETILAEIERAVDKARDEMRKEFGEAVEEIDPIEWIRYFAIFNQMGHARHQHWHNLRRIGFGRGIPFVFEEYRWISGLPFFDELNCPHCVDLARLARTVVAAQRINADATKQWATDRIFALRPVALDTPGFQKAETILLPRAIDLLGRDRPSEVDKFHVSNVDEAILRFYELIYLSYPPTDALRALQAPNAWPLDGDDIAIVAEYERFRWAILEWCILNWPRLVANSARSAFFACCENEISAESALVERLLDSLIHHRNDELTRVFISSAVRKLASLEAKQRSQSAEEDRSSSRRLLLIENGLTLFMLGMTLEERAKPAWIAETPDRSLLDLLSEANLLIPGELSFVRNLHLRFSRPRRFADPAWALEAVAETLFRGRDPDDATGGSHRLLPKLLYEILEDSDRPRTRRLLQSSLSLFLAALADLTPFAAESALPIEDVNKAGNFVLKWLTNYTISAPPPEDQITSLIDLLARRAEFCKRFDVFFHGTVDDLRSPLFAQRDDVLKKNPQFTLELIFAKKIARARVLTPFHRLVTFLTNWAIDPAIRRAEPSKSRIEVHRHRMPIGTDRLRFRLLTNFEPLAVTNDCTMHGRNHDVEFRMLRLFGADLPDHWIEPSTDEKGDNFTSCYEFYMPVGFTPPNPP